MRFAAFLTLALSAMMLVLAPTLVNAQAMAALQPQQQAAHASDCHETAPARPAAPDKQQSQCLTQCLAAHGGVLPHMPDAGAAYTPLPHVIRPALARAMVSAPTALDPPPPRLA